MIKMRELTICLAAAAFFTIPLAASAAEKLAVQDGSGNTKFSVHDNGTVGINNASPNYAADVVSNGSAAKSQLHFSLTGADNGGYLTSVSENNFWISSGGVYDGPAGGWIQKSLDGKSVFFGSGPVGFRAYMNQGNTPGQIMTNVNQVMLVDYSGNLTMNGGLQMNNGSPAKPACTSSVRGMLWMSKSSSGYKDVVEICAQGSGGALGWYPIF